MNSALFNINAVNQLDRGGIFFDRSEYVRSIIIEKKRSVKAVVISTYSLRADDVSKDSDFLYGDVPTLVLHGSRYFKSHDLVHRLHSSVTVASIYPRIDSGTLEKQRGKGVHHPKYILVFTSDGLHAVVSTANFGKQTSVDLSWCQFFPILGMEASKKTHSEDAARIGSDFGIVLEDLLEHEFRQVSEVDEHEQAYLTSNAKAWLEQRIGDVKLTKKYDFSDAQVDLISTIPCRYPIMSLEEESRINSPTVTSRGAKRRCRHCCQFDASLSCSPHAYGLLRQKQLVDRHYSLLGRSLTPDDLLIAQPTSISSETDMKFASFLLSCLMPESEWLTAFDREIVESLRLVWPSRDFIRNADCRVDNDSDDLAASLTKKRSRLDSTSERAIGGISVSTSLTTTSNSDEASDTVTETAVEAAETVYSRYPDHSDAGSSDGLFHLFLQARDLALMPLDLKTQMWTYAVNDCPALQSIRNFPPHVKTYARLMTPAVDTVTPVVCAQIHQQEDERREGKGEEEQKKGCSVGVDCSCCCYPVAWLTMTSACFSRGAQGEMHHTSTCKECGNQRQSYLECKNFELGVMFHSRPGRRYRALNPRCPVHRCGYSEATAAFSVAGLGTTLSSFSNVISHKDSDVVVLPVPYDLLGGEPYCDSEANGYAFRIRPYLNENGNESRRFISLPKEAGPTSAV